MKLQQNIELWKSIYGSHIWGMERPDSDIDYFICYASDPRDFWMGNEHVREHHSQTETNDSVSAEIGHIIYQLKSGNINKIWGVMSPLIESSYMLDNGNIPYLQLKTIVENNQSKNIYHSAHGLAIEDLKKLHRQEITSEHPLYHKKINVIARSILFAINCLNGNGYLFQKTDINDEKEIDGLLLQLEQSRSQSLLPDKPEYELYDDFLINLRRDMLTQIESDKAIQWVLSGNESDSD